MKQQYNLIKANQRGDQKFDNPLTFVAADGVSVELERNKRIFFKSKSPNLFQALD